jgi:hypothetical protein
MTGSKSLEPTERSAPALEKTKDGVASALASKIGAGEATNVAATEAARRHALIAETAYLLYEQRHFDPGHDVEDWLAAESALNLK